MLQIRKVTDVRTSQNRTVVQQVQQIIRDQFPGIAEADVEKLPGQLANPFRYRFVSELLVAEDSRGNVRGFALLLFAQSLRPCPSVPLLVLYRYAPFQLVSGFLAHKYGGPLQVRPVTVEFGLPPAAASRRGLGAPQSFSRRASGARRF
mgnify:CR=1 FL=1